MPHFDIRRDIEIERNGGFWCEACLVGKPAAEQSPDDRYCKECFALLVEEAKALSPQSRPKWIPKVDTLESKNTGEKVSYAHLPINKEKTKMSTLNSPSPTVDNFRPRGRPKTYKKKELPEEQIKQLHGEGMGTKAIATKLKGEGETISYKTIQRILAGQRH